jgi:6-phospho-beta-glucosidase
MKIAVIGGAGVRTPLLVNGLTQSDLPINEIALFDTDVDRLRIIAPLAASFSPTVRTCDNVRDCVAGAAFVLLSIRVGGIRARVRDETVAVRHDVVGQETVGAGGFAMAMRTIPHAVRYAQVVREVSPDAWIVSFTNPVGIVTEAMTKATTATTASRETETASRVIGICDTPTELFEDVAQLLELESARCRFDYFGLNHLGWLREVYSDGAPQLHRLWERPDLLRRIYRTSLFAPEFLSDLRMLPTEYLYYYYSAGAALANIRKAGQTRGQAIQELNDRLFDDLAAAGADAGRVYEGYLAARNAGYMQIESGASQPIARSPWAELTGYDKIALSVIRAIHRNSNAIIPLNVPNRGALRDLEDDDVVEVPCVVNANGAHPLAVGPVPASVRDLLLQVKDYERLTVAAAASGAAEDAGRALAANPLIGDRDHATRLVAALHSW